MSVIFTNSNTSSKQKWTREQSEALIACVNEGGTRDEAAAATGHPANSITYQVRRIKAAELKLVGEGKEVSQDAVLDVIFG